MKIKELFQEAPIPDDWDKSMFINPRSIKRMIDYAKEKAERIGQGSSRVAFLVDYQGRKTILKVAKKRTKGIAQNKGEINILTDSYVENLNITIPVIDYDEENGDNPTWIHMEYADKITEKQLEMFFEYPIDEICQYLDGITGKRAEIDLPEHVLENEYFMRFQDLILNLDLTAVEYEQITNWGLYRGHPVIIDLGFTREVERLYRL